MLFVGVYKDLLFMKAYQGVVLVVSEENRSFFRTCCQMQSCLQFQPILVTGPR